MERVTITEEMVNNAVSYAPIRMKEEFIDYCYMRCLNKVSVDLDAEGGSAMPNMYMENTFLKARYLMSALAVMYLGFKREELEMEENDLWLMSESEYDRFARSHVIGQLNRFRHADIGLKDKVFDLLRDYGDLERRMNSAVRSGLSVMNDPANRIFQKLTMDISQEAIESYKKQLEDIQKVVDENGSV